MNLISYFFLGLLVAIIGALPLGTTNVAVINTTIKENIQSALKIIYTAALAEIILVLIAIRFNLQIENFVAMNLHLQYTIALLLLAVGIVLILRKKECMKDEKEECILIKKRKFQVDKQMLGFILGLVNPTVLIYWILVISFLSEKRLYLSLNKEYLLLIFFLSGAFIGKALTLYGYGKFSNVLKARLKNKTTRINTIIGTLLICISIFQFSKIFYY